ncbi:hypothetical protein IGI04_002548, partial [Brassica rapa subsp. trilocularis]
MYQTPFSPGYSGLFRRTETHSSLKGKVNNMKIHKKGLSLAREWNETQSPVSKGQKTHSGTQINRIRESIQPNLQIATCKTNASWDVTRYKSGLAWIIIKASRLSLAREWNETQSPVSKGQKTHSGTQINRIRESIQPNLQIATCKTNASWDVTRYKSGLAWIIIKAS